MINLAIVTVYHDVTRLTRKKITRYNKCRANKHLYTKKFRIINTSPRAEAVESCMYDVCLLLRLQTSSVDRVVRSYLTLGTQTIKLID